MKIILLLKTTQMIKLKKSFGFFEGESHSVAWAGVEFSMYPRLALSLKQSCLR